jgi:hypothetical protein
MGMSIENQIGHKDQKGVASRPVSWAAVAQNIAGPYFNIEDKQIGIVHFNDRLAASLSDHNPYWVDSLTAKKLRNESTYICSIANNIKSHPEGKPMIIKLPSQDQGYVVLLSAFFAAKSLTQKEIVLMVEDDEVQTQNRIDSFQRLKPIVRYLPPVVHRSRLEDQLKASMSSINSQIVSVPPRIVVIDKNEVIDVYRMMQKYQFVPRLIMFETDKIKNDTRHFVDKLLAQNYLILVWKKPNEKLLELDQIEHRPTTDSQTDTDATDSDISKTKLGSTANDQSEVIMVPNKKKRILASKSGEAKKDRNLSENNLNLTPAEAFFHQTGIDLSQIDKEIYVKNRRRVSRRLWRQLLDVFRDHPEWPFEKICQKLGVDPHKNKDKFSFRFQSMAEEFNGISRAQTSPVQYLASLCEEMLPYKIAELPGADFLTPNQWDLFNYLLNITDEEDLLDLTYTEIKDALGLVSQTKAKETIELIARTIHHPEYLNTPRAIFLKATGVDLAQPDGEELKMLYESISDSSVMGKRIRSRLDQFEIAFQTKPNGSYEELSQLFEPPMKNGARDSMNSILDYLDKKPPSQPRSPASYIKVQTGLEYAAFIRVLFDSKLFQSLTPDDVTVLTCFDKFGPEATYELVAEEVHLDRTTVSYYLKKAVNIYLSASTGKSQPEVKKINPYATLVSEIGITPSEILRQPNLTKNLYPEDITALKLLSAKGGDELTIYGLGHMFDPPIIYPAVIRMTRRIGILVKRELDSSA